MKMVIVRAPLRISFVGGGSDIPPGPGKTISTTIDKWVYCIVRTRTDGKFYLSWKEKEVTDSIDEIKHDIVRESVKYLGMGTGLEICFMADIPASGSGLGSSAATCVSLVHALLLLKGFSEDAISREWLAATACHIQINCIGNKQGFQDEYASAIGGLLQVSYSPGVGSGLRCRVERESIFISNASRELLNESFMLFSPQYGAGRNANDILGDYEFPVDFREECMSICDMFKIALLAGTFDLLGPLIYQHHVLKCGLTKLFAPDVKLDDIHYKLCGAGSTGHLLVHCSMAEKQDIKKVVEVAWGPELPFKFTTTGSETIYRE